MKISQRKYKMPKPKKPVKYTAPALEWINDVTGRAPRATAIGSRRLLVENHKGILDFTSDLVRLSTAFGPLQVHGSGLSLCEVRKDALIVHGSIRQVELPDEGGAQ